MIIVIIPLALLICGLIFFKEDILESTIILAVIGLLLAAIINLGAYVHINITPTEDAYIKYEESFDLSPILDSKNQYVLIHYEDASASYIFKTSPVEFDRVAASHATFKYGDHPYVQTYRKDFHSPVAQFLFPKSIVRYVIYIESENNVTYL